MSNRIRSLSISDLKDPAHAEISIRAYTERVTNKTEIRGRLTGPRCAYSSTVEVAYPIRMVKHEYGKEDHPYVSTQVIIPEPCFWEPETPFLYQGIIELWQSGQKLEQVTITRALREIKLGPGGLRVNGRPFTLRGIARNQFHVNELPELRKTGFNTLFAPVPENCFDLYEAADRLGVFIIWQLTRRECIVRLGSLDNQDHPSLLGGVLMPEAEEPEIIWLLASPFFSIMGNSFAGCWLTSSSPGKLPERCRFVLCEKTLLAFEINLPKLVLVNEAPEQHADINELSSSQGILGWIVDQTK